MASDDLYHAGLALIGLSVALAAVALPALRLAGKRLAKRLDADYGERGRPRAHPPADL